MIYDLGGGQTKIIHRKSYFLRLYPAMSSTYVESKAEPIELDLTSAFSFERGFGRSELLLLGPQLEEARRSLVAAMADGRRCDLTVAQRVLSEYKIRRRESLLGQILQLARRLRDAVDQMVIVAPIPLAKAAEVLFAACCHPYHNELSRGQRGGRPRIHFVPAAPDNDSIQALLEILPRNKLLHTVDESWGLLAIDAHPQSCARDSRLVMGLFIAFWEALQSTTTAEGEARRSAVVGPAPSHLVALADQIGIPRIVESQQSPFDACDALPLIWANYFHPGVLLAASVMGMDVVKLLRGAAAMLERFTTQPPGDNPALDFCGLSRLLADRRGIDGYQIDSTATALAPLAQDLQCRNGDNDLLIQLVPRTIRHDHLDITISLDGAVTSRPKRAVRSLPDLAQEHAEQVRKARDCANQPTAM